MFVIFPGFIVCGNNIQYSFEQQALNEKQNDAVTAASKELSLRKDYLEENLKLALELKV